MYGQSGFFFQAEDGIRYLGRSRGLGDGYKRQYLVNADGSLGARNGIYCGGLEHKMGIHANATAQLSLIHI